MGYSFYYPPKNQVLVARNAEFLENSLINQEASGSLKDLKIIQEEDTNPSIDTSLNHEEDDLEIDEPQSDIIPIRSLGTSLDLLLLLWKARIPFEGKGRQGGDGGACKLLGCLLGDVIEVLEVLGCFKNGSK
ncbi:hypothetical protein Tco_1554214 [Tanacetum coccineum]